VDIERTIEFILETQAKAEVRVDAMEKRIDRRMDAITKLLQQGMRMLVKTDTKLAAIADAQRRTDIRLAELAKTQKDLTAAQKDLAAAQKATDRSLKAFIDSLRQGRNGR